MKRICKSIAIIVLCLAMLTGSSFALTFSKIVVFGDSLSDNGNVYILSSGASPASTNSYNGRYSDGPVWAEYLTQYFSAGLVDLAQGGAQTGDNDSVPVGLKKQVSDFTDLLVSYPALASDDTLYAVWAGPNDFLEGGMDVTSAVNNIGDALNTLAAAGAKYIIIPNMANLGATPLNNNSPILSAGAQGLTQNFNTALESVVDAFKQANSAITVYDFDTYALFANVLADPSSYGFTNTTDSYVNDDDTVNNDGNSYFFWDSVHPTTEGHRLFAQTVAALIGGSSAAWFSSSGLLNIPQILVGGYSASYNVILEYIGPISSDPYHEYFRLDTITDNNP